MTSCPGSWSYAEILREFRALILNTWTEEEIFLVTFAARSAMLPPPAGLSLTERTPLTKAILLRRKGGTR